MKIKLLAIATLALVAGCNAFIPTPTQPCPGLYCAQWTFAGVTLDVCENSQAALNTKMQTLQTKYPESTFK